MTPDHIIDLVLRTAPAIIAGLAAGFAWATVRKVRQTRDAAIEVAEVAMDMLGLMEQAHDPGRDVADRLARSLEARMVTDRGEKVEPAIRRAGAQVMAAHTIEAIRAANLVLSDGEPFRSVLVEAIKDLREGADEVALDGLTTVYRDTWGTPD